MAELVTEFCIGPRLEDIAHEEFAITVPQRLKAIKQHSATVGRSVYEDTCGFLAKNFKSVFSDGGKAPSRNADASPVKKTFLVSRVVAQTQEFEVLGIERSDDPMDGNFERRYALEGTLTGAAMKSEEPFFVLDLASASNKGLYLPVAKGARCGIACRMAHGGSIFGAVVILSSHYDISLERHGRIIRLLADEAGEILSCRVTGNVVATFAELRHDICNLLDEMECLVPRNANDVSESTLEQISAYVECIADLMDAHCRSGPLTPTDFSETCLPMQVRKIVDQCVHVVSFRHKDIQIDTSGVPEQLEARVNQAFFRACVLNLLRNAIQHMNGSSDRIFLRCEVKDSYLQTYLTNRVGATTEDLDAWLSNSMEQTLDDVKGELSPARKGLKAVRRLAAWHEVQDGRRGCLRRVDLNGDLSTGYATLLLQLPCGTH